MISAPCVVWCLKGKDSASTPFCPHSILSTTVKWCYAAVKLMQEQDPGWSLLPLFLSILRACFWKFYSRLVQGRNWAQDSQSLSYLLQKQIACEDMGILAKLFLCRLGASRLPKKPLSSPAHGKELACVHPFVKEGWGRSPFSFAYIFCGQEEL